MRVRGELAVKSSDPGRVEVPLPVDATNARDVSASVGDVPGSSAAAAPYCEGNLNEFSIDYVYDPTLELFLDPLLHPDKVACMLEFRHRFYEYFKVSSHTICNVIVVDI